MKIEILNEKENPLLERKEMEFKVIHDKGSPKLDEVRKKISANLNLKNDFFVIHGLHSTYGMSESEGFLKIYETKERMEQIENKYVLIRNGLMEVEKKGEKVEEEEKKSEEDVGEVEKKGEEKIEEEKMKEDEAESEEEKKEEGK